MYRFPYFCYSLVLALWVGGVAIFTFIVTPAIFKSFARDMAGQIVEKLFPGYFSYNLILSLLALIFFFTLGGIEKIQNKLSLVLIIAAILINVFVAFKLHPDVKRIKQEIASFESVPQDSPLRIRFKKLHAVSASLNLLLLADGVTLLFFSGHLKT